MVERSYRNIKDKIRSLFEQIKEEGNLPEDFLDRADKITGGFIRSNPTICLSPIVSFLSSPDSIAKWGAVTLIGRLVSQQANSDMEWARTVMRRFMWYLNDESGGIGWGVPEAMGEVLRHHHGLALEYGKILWSYIDPEGNHLENDDLVEGALWGIARMVTAWKDVGGWFSPNVVVDYIRSSRIFSRLYAGILLLCFEKLGHYKIKGELSHIKEEGSLVISFFWDGRFLRDSVENIILNGDKWILWTKDMNTT
ncbi:MAG: hypothetical protein N2260_00360 [Syntrophobacterales bacterium]|nr:hypothetical protein [Syntrophobacterales bacterium]